MVVLLYSSIVRVYVLLLCESTNHILIHCRVLAKHWSRLCIPLNELVTPPRDLDVMPLCDWFNHFGGQNKTSPDTVFTYMLDYNFNIYKFILFYVLNYMNRNGK